MFETDGEQMQQSSEDATTSNCPVPINSPSSAGAAGAALPSTTVTQVQAAPPAPPAVSSTTSQSLLNPVPLTAVYSKVRNAFKHVYAQTQERKKQQQPQKQGQKPSQRLKPTNNKQQPQPDQQDQKPKLQSKQQPGTGLPPLPSGHAPKPPSININKDSLQAPKRRRTHSNTPASSANSSGLVTSSANATVSSGPATSGSSGSPGDASKVNHQVASSKAGSSADQVGSRSGGGEATSDTKTAKQPVWNRVNKNVYVDRTKIQLTHDEVCCLAWQSATFSGQRQPT